MSATWLAQAHVFAFPWATSTAETGPCCRTGATEAAGAGSPGTGGLAERAGSVDFVGFGSAASGLVPDQADSEAADSEAAGFGGAGFGSAEAGLAGRVGSAGGFAG